MKFLPGEEFLPGWEPLLQAICRTLVAIEEIS